MQLQQKNLGNVNTMQPINWAHRLNHGRIAWWKILPNSGWSGGPTLLDLCKKSHCTLAGTTKPTWVGSRGLKGSSGTLFFDGSTGYASCVQGGRFSLSGSAFSIALWIKDDSSAATLGSTAHRAISWYDGSKNIQFGLNGNATNRQAYLYNGTTNANPSVTSTGSLALGFNRLLGTFDGSTYHIYVNGVQLDGGTHSSVNFAGTNSTNVFLGQRMNGAGFILGTADDFSIWNRALSSQEALADYIVSQTGYPGVLNYLSPVSYFGVTVSTSGLLLRRRRAYSCL